MSLSILNRCPGKHSVTLDLKKPGALEVYFDLVRRADVVVENYTAGTADRLGIGYAATREVNERVVYCSISGFGQDSDPGVPVYDNVIQALSGLMMANGGTDDPPIRRCSPSSASWPPCCVGTRRAPASTSTSRCWAR
jgi:crotonobetainyl-CoA:carnitine CoA-transferase CaiB-like acyl-CoA transferase